MKNIYKSISVLALIIGLQSCTTAVIDESSTVVPPSQIGPVKYNPDVKSIMTNNCITCHGGPAPSAGLDLTNYNNVKASSMNNLIDRINNQANPMPPNGLMISINRQKMLKWVEDGYPEN